MDGDSRLHLSHFSLSSLLFPAFPLNLLDLDMNSQLAPRISLAIEKSVKKSFDEYLETKNKGLPRLAVLATTSTNNQLVNSVAGFERNGIDSRLTEDSLFPLWSANKLFTVIAALQLVEQGIIRIEDEASKWVKELNGLKVLTGFREDDEPVYEEAEKNCTIEMLMLHTAGEFSFMSISLLHYEFDPFTIPLTALQASASRTIHS